MSSFTICPAAVWGRVLLSVTTSVIMRGSNAGPWINGLIISIADSLLSPKRTVLAPASRRGFQNSFFSQSPCSRFLESLSSWSDHFVVTRRQLLIPLHSQDIFEHDEVLPS